jgi:dTDP-glucose pyrophosphorylase
MKAEKFYEKYGTKTMLVALPESIEDIIIVTSPNTVSKFKAQFGEKSQVSKGLKPITYVVQSDDMAGTYGALHSAKPYLKKDFIVLNGDDIIDAESIEELMQDNINKLKKDWERKIVLPEIKKAFEDRNKFVNEQAGNFPNKFL